MEKQTFERLSEFQRSLISGPEAALSPEAQYLTDKEHFYSAIRRCEMGDNAELQILAELGKAHIASSRKYYASSANYFDDLALARAAMERLLSMQGTSVAVDSSALPDDLPHFSQIHQQIKRAIENNEPELAIDRLHSWVMGYFRSLCERLGISTEKKALHSLAGEYVKKLKEQGKLETRMADHLLTQSISLTEMFNQVRNQYSSAHANPLLKKPEAQLIVEYVASTIRFIQKIEANE